MELKNIVTLHSICCNRGIYSLSSDVGQMKYLLVANLEELFTELHFRTLSAVIRT